MRRISLKTWGLTLAAATLAVAVTATRTAATAEPQTARPRPHCSRSARLTFGPDGVLFAADRSRRRSSPSTSARQRTGGAPGRRRSPAIDTQIASLLGTDVREIADHRSRRSSEDAERVSLGDARSGRRRRAGPAARRRRRQDRGRSRSTSQVHEGRPAERARRGVAAQQQRAHVSITDMAFVDGRCSSPACRTRSSRRSCARCRIRSRRSTAAPASRSTTATTASSRRARRCYTFVPYKRRTASRT